MKEDEVQINRDTDAVVKFIKGLEQRTEQRIPTATSFVFDEAAKILEFIPGQQSDFVLAISEWGGQTANHVDHEINKAIERREELGGKPLGELAAERSASYSIYELLPSKLARLVEQECSKTNSRDLVTAMLMLTATASLIGSRVQMESRVMRGLVPANLYYLITGDSSKVKSAACVPVIDSMQAFGEKKEAEMLAKIKYIQENPDGKDAAQCKKEIFELQDNQQVCFRPVGSMSAEGIVRQIMRQEARGGYLLFRDEASGLFDYKRYSGGTGGAASAGDSATDCFSNLIITGFTKALFETTVRADESKNMKARQQTLSIAGCLQNKYIDQFLDFAVDNNGWTARWIFIRSTDGTSEIKAKRLEASSSALTVYLNEQIIPFTSSIRPISLDSQSSLVLNFDDVVRDDSGVSAQDLYERKWDAINDEADVVENNGIELAYATYLRKGQVRLLKLCLLLHVLNKAQGAKEHSFGQSKTNPLGQHGYEGHKAVNTPISKETLEMAIRWEDVLIREYQEIGIDAVKAHSRITQAYEAKESINELQLILAYIKEAGSVSETIIKQNLKTRKRTRTEIGQFIKQLEERGCINKVKEGQTYRLSFLKSLRS